MSIKMGLMAQKHECLKKRYRLEQVYGNYETITHCEICEEELPTSYRISKSLNFWGLKVPGEFHHDENQELHLYCYTCHKRIHDWGLIQRWLMKIGKTVDDLPDASKTSPMMRKYGWG